MEQIAVISDIHGNIPAYEAVLEDIRQRGITRIFCLGDMVGKGPHPEIAVDMVRETCDQVVKGNWDELVVKLTEDENFKWHKNRLGEDRLTYLKSLPMCIEFHMSGRLVRLFHASPRSLFERIHPGNPLEERISLLNPPEKTSMQDIESDVAGYGDIHNAYVQNFHGKTLLNTGSVGNPLEITQASYAILEGEYENRQPGSFSVQLVRVPYDIDLAVHQAEKECMPELEAYIQELRTAKYRGLTKQGGK